jgi:hypothetical protein
MLKCRVINSSVLEKPILNMFVQRHDGFDVFQVVQAGTVGDLVEGTDRDEV